MQIKFISAKLCDLCMYLYIMQCNLFMYDAVAFIHCKVWAAYTQNS